MDIPEENHEINQFVNGEISSVVWRIFGEQEYVECLSQKCVHSLSDDWAFISMYSVTWSSVKVDFFPPSSFIWGKMHHYTVAFSHIILVVVLTWKLRKRPNSRLFSIVASKSPRHHNVKNMARVQSSTIMPCHFLCRSFAFKKCVFLCIHWIYWKTEINTECSQH